MVFVDTSVWIDYVRGIDAPHTAALDRELQYNQVVSGDLIIAEFLQGFRSDRDFEAAHLSSSVSAGSGSGLAKKAGGVRFRSPCKVHVSGFC
ncbi:hypothetical protein AGMMS49928_02700 [Spirochaetia bacterium]|nr:hypothetical protein AGMMS49928_02700 [Spirochaetia bacterium]